MTSQTTSSQNGEPRERAMLAGVRKIPTPITSPMTSAVTEVSPSSRESALCVVVSYMGDVSSPPRRQPARVAASLSLTSLTAILGGPNHESHVAAVGGCTRRRAARSTGARTAGASQDGRHHGRPDGHAGDDGADDAGHAVHTPAPPRPEGRPGTLPRSSQPAHGAARRDAGGPGRRHERGRDPPAGARAGGERSRARHRRHEDTLPGGARGHGQGTLARAGVGGAGTGVIERRATCQAESMGRLDAYLDAAAPRDDEAGRVALTVTRGRWAHER